MKTIVINKSHFILVLILTCSFTSWSQQFKILLFTKTAGYHHESIQEGVSSMRLLASRNNFKMDWREDASIFSDKDLEGYQAIVFLNTTGDILNTEQQMAFEKFIKAGKGFVGIHSASDTEYDWVWYTKLVGMMFKIHPEQQTAYLKVEDSQFPGMERFPKRLLWTDEWYEFGEKNVDDLHFLVSVDEKTYSPTAKWDGKSGNGMGSFHPISWYHKYDGGRAFYTAMGHIPLIYSDQTFLDHIYGGIYWAATGKGL
jgi:uncharacterized protein